MKRILAIDDDPADLRLIEEAVRSANMDVEFKSTTDPHKAHKLIRNERPSLVILDLNMPQMSGFEVLDTIRSDDAIKHIPVLLLTTSSNPADVKKAYSNYANAFVTKPVDLEEFLGVFADMAAFWLNRAHLPEAAAEQA